jgi:hypothetical protein
LEKFCSVASLILQLEGKIMSQTGLESLQRRIRLIIGRGSAMPVAKLTIEVNTCLGTASPDISPRVYASLRISLRGSLYISCVDSQQHQH